MTMDGIFSAIRERGFLTIGDASAILSDTDPKDAYIDIMNAVQDGIIAYDGDRLVAGECFQ